ncbi:MAG TPA: MBL fold metallo-hydrolase [Actinomycetota bacterium]|nr:MBL fold metallo-hydrolase [Actinomycetota bacterium]
MRLTKFGHACVRLENDGRTLVIDPGTLTEPDAFDGAEAVLITHEHPDHLDGARLAAAADRSRGLAVWSTGPVVEQLDGIGAELRVVVEGDSFSAAGFEIAVIGKLHGLANPAWPRVPNVGFLVDGRLFHPGDAFTVPGVDVDTLLLPTSGPWVKAPEFVDYVSEVGPARAYSVHDGFLNEAGLAVIDRILASLDEDGGREVRRLAPRESVDLA